MSFEKYFISTFISIECTCGSALGCFSGANGAGAKEEGSRKNMRNMFVSGDQRHLFDVPDSCNVIYDGMCLGNTRKRRWIDDTKSGTGLADREVQHTDKQPRCSASDIVLDDVSSEDGYSDDGSDVMCGASQGVGSIRVHLPEGYHRVVSSHRPHACIPPRDASLWAIVPYVGVNSKEEEQKQDDVVLLQNETMNNDSESMMMLD